MSGFWRRVVDLSDQAETPARRQAATRVGVTVGALALVGVLAVGVASSWTSPWLINLGFLAVFGLCLTARGRYRLTRRRGRTSRPFRSGPNGIRGPERGES